MGYTNVFYAVTCVKEYLCNTIVVYQDHTPLGIGLYYNIPLRRTSQYVTIIYYVAVTKRKQGRNLGKVIVSSIEELNRDAQAFVATTKTNNVASIKMFTSLGYVTKHASRLYENMKPYLVDKLVRATCSYEDDVFLVKTVNKDATLSKLIELLDEETIASIWEKICYNPWLKLRMNQKYF